LAPDKLRTPALAPVYPVAEFRFSAVEPEIAPPTPLNADVELMESVVILETLPPIDALPDPALMVRGTGSESDEMPTTPDPPAPEA